MDKGVSQGTPFLCVIRLEDPSLRSGSQVGRAQE